MVDTLAARPYRHRLPVGYPGIAVDAGMAVHDFGFSVPGLELIRMVVVETNRLSLRAVVAGGGRIVGTRHDARTGGATRKLIDLEFTREDWAAWKAQPARLAAGRRAVRRR